MAVCVYSTCPDPEKQARVIKCSGPCKGTYHIACVRVSGPHLKACQENDGISWVCIGCRDHREDAILEKVKKNKLAVYDLATYVEKVFEVLVSKMDTNSSMITELAATITTSNAINAEMLSTRPSLGLAHLSPDESLSAVHERVRESLSASLDRLFSRDANGESALSRKRRGVDSESDPTNKRVKPSALDKQTPSVPDRISPGNVDAQAQDAPLPLTSTPGNTSSQVHEIQLPSTSTQNPPAVNTTELVDRSVPMDISNTLTGSYDAMAPQQNSNPSTGSTPQTTSAANTLPGNDNTNKSQNQQFIPAANTYPGYYFAPWQYPNPIIPWYPPGQQMYQPDTLTWPPVQPQLLQGQNVAVNRHTHPLSAKQNSRSARGVSLHGAAQSAASTRRLDDCLTFCVRNLAPETTEDDVGRYIASKNIPPNAVICTSLTKPRKKISFKTFKVEIERQFADKLTSMNFWPAGVTIAPYERFNAVALPAIK